MFLNISKIPFVTSGALLTHAFMFQQYTAKKFLRSPACRTVWSGRAAQHRTEFVVESDREHLRSLLFLSLITRMQWPSEAHNCLTEAMIRSLCAT